MDISVEKVIDAINQKIKPTLLSGDLVREVEIATLGILKLEYANKHEADSLVQDVADIIQLIRDKMKYKFIGGKHSIISTMLASETPDMDIVTPIDLDNVLNLILPKEEGMGHLTFDQCDFALKRLFASSLIDMGRPSNIVLLKEDGTKESFQKPGYTVLQNGEIIIDIESFRSTVLGANAAQGLRQKCHDPNFIEAIRQLAKLGGGHPESANLIH